VDAVPGAGVASLRGPRQQLQKVHGVEHLPHGARCVAAQFPAVCAQQPHLHAQLGRLLVEDVDGRCHGWRLRRFSLRTGNLESPGISIIFVASHVPPQVTQDVIDPLQPLLLLLAADVDRM